MKHKLITLLIVSLFPIISMAKEIPLSKNCAKYYLPKKINIKLAFKYCNIDAENHIPHGIYAMGYLYDKIKNYPQAEKYYKLALKYEPKKACYALGGAL